MKKDYINTINIYRQLGKKYLKDIKNGEPKTISDFLNQLKPKSLILDVGCAGGRDAKIFTKAEHQVIGIDIVEEFLKEAKKNVPKAKFKKMDLMNLKFPDNNFDAIWAMAVLLHFSKTDGKKIIKSFYERLKPDLYELIVPNSFNNRFKIKILRVGSIFILYYSFLFLPLNFSNARKTSRGRAKITVFD